MPLTLWLMIFSGARSLGVLEAQWLHALHFGGVSESLNYVKTFTYVCILLAERTARFPKYFRTTVRAAAVDKCHQVAHDVAFLKRATSPTPRGAVCVRTRRFSRS